MTEASDARPGDYVEFYAELNIGMAMSLCPLGSGRYPAESGQRDTKPIVVEIYDTEIKPQAFSYAGLQSVSREQRIEQQ